MGTHFDVLGLPRRYDLDLSQLESLYLERSREVHPDRHAKADGATRARALLESTELNEAYRTLKHPIRRAEYLLRLEGFDLGSEEPKRVEHVSKSNDPAALRNLVSGQAAWIAAAVPPLVVCQRDPLREL